MLPSILRAPWQAGPEASTPGPVLVSVTEFTADRHGRTLPIALSGLRLRRSWPTTPGAVGMWLWLDPWHKRSGSVSVWADERSLYGFVGRPDHLRIVRAYRHRGTARATTWTADQLDPNASWAAAHALICDPTPWPDKAVHTSEGP
ncbi:hypothetical protein GCM10009837_16620 [Streptomyces durmitorensis]|uniref:Transposase n=1 Tax=Streptomyces durmitorensis TaxID=319947 RepID=A0ABY4PPA3_9ACTN|nr:hypothetical protein [Streptomyces durmitorensis]UQT55637.1 hypothetical protein M4V62_11325 [Streptomyces durmitorensis]